MVKREFPERSGVFPGTFPTSGNSRFYRCRSEAMLRVPGTLPPSGAGTLRTEARQARFASGCAAACSLGSAEPSDGRL
jgi:hypothetical protein